MPCRSDYMEPNAREIELSAVKAFIKELYTGKLTKKHLDGRHPQVYNQCCTQEDLDEETAALCDTLEQLDPSVIAKRSLELQIWWRDHKASDKQRKAKEKKEEERKKLRESGLKKLTAKEKKALGL